MFSREEDGADVDIRYLELIWARMFAASTGCMRQARSFFVGGCDGTGSWNYSTASCRPAWWRWRRAAGRTMSVGARQRLGHHGPVDVAGICPALCEGAEERRPRRRGDRGGGDAPDDALRSAQERGAIDIQALHRARERLVAERTALINQLRALLLERGIVVPQGRPQLDDGLESRRATMRSSRLSPRIRLLVERHAAEWPELDQRITAFDAEFVADGARG